MQSNFLHTIIFQTHLHVQSPPFPFFPRSQVNIPPQGMLGSIKGSSWESAFEGQAHLQFPNGSMDQVHGVHDPTPYRSLGWFTGWCHCFFYAEKAEANSFWTQDKWKHNLDSFCPGDFLYFIFSGHVSHTLKNRRRCCFRIRSISWA